MSATKIRHALNRAVASKATGAVAEVGSILDMLEDELEAYSEFILAPETSAVGFMTRGEGSSFSDRVSGVIRRLDLPPAALEHHLFLADMFEHKRGFFKVEWHFDESGQARPMAACYFRRRPDLETVLDKLQARGIATSLSDQIRLLAYTLEKRSVHFVAAAFRRNSSVHHKLYFSQYVTGPTRAQVDARLERALERTGLRPALLESWRQIHPQMIDPTSETSLFVSVNLTDDESLPWIKIDYPNVAPSAASSWLPQDQREQVVSDAQTACQVVGNDHLSFLGVRLRTDRDHAMLKYYADFPDRSMVL